MEGFDHKSFLKTLTSKPGVYRMMDARGDVIYVGKAKNLKRRVSSYFRNSSLAVKTEALVTQICNIEITVTATEAEALIMESNLIKQLKPRYNILLKDDKSYPLIRISRGDYPRISYYRGTKNRKDAEYFGPYPSSGAVKETLGIMQKLFKLRPCEDSYFNNRSRPCLQYQIKRCSAPCVGIVSKDDYALDLDNARLFLQGRSQEIVSNLIADMDKAAESLAYEKAATIRDQIQDVQKVIEQQLIGGAEGDVDAVAAVIDGGICCVSIHFIRNGYSLGSQHFFPKAPKDTSLPEILEAFVAQYYLRQSIPSEIILNHALEEVGVLADALSLHADRKVKIIQRPREHKAKWLKLAQTNAEHSLAVRLASKEGVGKRLDALRKLIQIDDLPQWLECFDISHTQGERTVASCVVFDGSGARKDAYRRFNIANITPGDDYAAMYQALHRRYARVIKEEGRLPDVLLIDGGKGQVAQARAVLQDLEIDSVTVVGVAKGPERKAGEETLILPHLESEKDVEPTNPGLHLIQQIRDEAHRFAITGHRERRSKARRTSPLESIPGVGAKRRQQLLKHFGGIQGIMRAGVDDIAKVPGISKLMAELIYENLKSDS